MQSVADRRAAGSLGRRVQQIIQQPLDGTEMRQALETLAATYSTQAVDSRRHRDVRSEMQEHTQQLDADFVRALGEVNAVFTDLEASVQHLDAQCSGLRVQVNSALRATESVSAQASLLVDEQRELAMRSTVARGVLEAFTLTDADTKVLDAGVIDDAYFDVLDRVDRTRRECQRLNVEQTAVSDLLVQLAQHEESAYSALLRWVLAEIRVLSRDTPEFSTRLKQALARLESHPVLFTTATAEIASARCDALHRAFLAALVRGGPNGTPRPIEAHAGDPQRFVGDMLAWVHQACASERELLDTMFSRSAMQSAHVPHMLAAALAGVARPLEIRMQQTVAELAAPAAVYRIDSLLGFYKTLFARVCSADSSFVQTVDALAAQARDKLAASLDSLADAVISDLDVQSGLVSPALDVPASLHALLAAVADILRLHEDSVQSHEASSVAALVTSVIGRVQSQVHELVQQLGHLRPYEQSMLELNIWSSVHDTLSAFVSMQDTASADALIDTLQEQLLGVLKQKSHLPFDSETKVSKESVELFNHTLKAAMDLDVSRLTSRLNNHAVARQVSEHVIQKFVQDYARVYQQYIDSGSDPSTLLSPDSVSTLM
ncbi:Golgi transport complex subunit 6 [Coemansia sp. RSA 1199]|nr:Golgi transport complex subunit 6 [Coemansia sp. RSA 1199]